MVKNNPSKSDGDISPTKIHATIKFFAVIALLLVLSTSISGCVTMADPEASQDYSADRVGVLDSQSSLGQSFVTRRPDLNGITIWVTRLPSNAGATPSSNTNVLTIGMFSSPSDDKPVFTKSMLVAASGTNLPISIPMPDQGNLAGQSFYLVLSNGTGTIQINGRNEDAYPLGQAYLNNQPINADIAFRLSYDYGFPTLLDDIKNSFRFFWLIVPFLFVLWLPGWLMLDFSGLRSRFDFAEQTALAVGLSLASIPLLMLWSSIIKLKWTSRGLYFAAGFLLAIFIVRVVYTAFASKKMRSRYSIAPSEQPSTPIKRIYSLINWQSLALILIFLVSLAVRLIMIRDLATPAWVDSVHHALITRQIMNTGYYPSTYLPYWSFPPTEYHPGFHSIAAVFTWLSQLDLARSLLILGQVLNALSVFAVYLLAKTLTRSAPAGLFAAIITGFLTPMPAYYTSWGRYTELTGLLLFPVVLALLQSWLDNSLKRTRVWIILLESIAIGGLFMIHYRVLLFMVCLLIPYAIFHLLPRQGATAAKPTQLSIFLASATVLSIILVIPWFIPTFKTTLLPYLTPTTATTIPPFQDFSWSYLTSALGSHTLVIAGIGLLWGALKGRSFTYLLIIWVVLLFFIANLAALKLPGGGLVNITSVEIMLFFPISLLGGYFIEQLLANWKTLIPHRFALPSACIVFLLFVYISFLGARQLIPILNPVTILSRQADLPAIQWVSDNIPQGETLVINPFAWGYNTYAGFDGGFWISPLSGRLTMPPPVLYGLDPDAAQISQLSQQIINLSFNPKAFRDLLNLHQLHYIYIGPRGGVIPPEKIALSGLFNLLYHHDDVWIFSTKP